MAPACSSVTEPSEHRELSIKHRGLGAAEPAIQISFFLMLGAGGGGTVHLLLGSFEFLFRFLGGIVRISLPCQVRKETSLSLLTLFLLIPLSLMAKSPAIVIKHCFAYK